ncbi:MAG TPA: hypothetical protein VF519_12325 [Mycobacteriales bacterium]
MDGGRDRDDAALRGALHAAFDAAPVSAFDLDGVRREAGRQRRRLTAVATAAAVVVAGSGVAGVSLLRRDRTAVVPTAAAPCPDVPLPAATAWRPGTATPGPADTMVPSRPVALRVCRYDWPDRHLGAEATVTMDDLGGRIVARLNALPQWDGTSYECTRGTLETYNVVVSLADGRTVVVAVEPEGCRWVSNGTRRAVYAPVAVGALLAEAVARG